MRACLRAVEQWKYIIYLIGFPVLGRSNSINEPTETIPQCRLIFESANGPSVFREQSLDPSMRYVRPECDFPCNSKANEKKNTFT